MTVEEGTTEIRLTVGNPTVEEQSKSEKEGEHPRVGIKRDYSNPTAGREDTPGEVVGNPTVEMNESVGERTANNDAELELIIEDPTATDAPTVEHRTEELRPGRERREKRVNARLTGYLWGIRRETKEEGRDIEEEEG